MGFALSLFLCLVFQLICLRQMHGQIHPDLCTNLNPPAVSSKCMSIAGTPCSQFYSHSIFPNQVTSDFNTSKSRFANYQVLYTKFDCSVYTQIYLCLALMPPCDPIMASSAEMGPCESLCELVKGNCSSVTQLSNENIDLSCIFSKCPRFPSTGCIAKDHSIVEQAIGIGSTEPSDYVDNSTLLACPLPNNTFYTGSAKSFAIGWTIFWSILCFISTLLTLFTFFLDTSRFEYPWRPVVYLALTFNLHSVAYFFSAALGQRLVTCPNHKFVESGSSWSWAHTPCLLVFITLYYTMMSAFLWWVVLAFGWFLVSALQWSHEAVNKLGPFFHVVCWMGPLLMTVALLAARVLGADELTGTCFVVRGTSTSSFFGLLIGVILPLLALLLIGIVFLVLGFLGILRVRAFMRKGGKQEERQILEKLMVRIGIFVAIYIIPASIVISCFFYELASRPSWQPLSVTCSSCRRANSAVFMVRTLMFLMIGVLTGTWIWSRKTLQSWARLIKCGPRCGSQEKTDLQAGASVNNVHSHVPSNYSYADSGLDSI